MILKKIIMFLIASVVMVSCGCEGRNNSELTHFKTALLCCSETVPVVDFKINGKSANFIVDTGSEISILDDEVYADAKEDYVVIDTIRININTVNGNSENVEMLEAKCYLNDSIPATFFITDIDNIIEQTFVNNGIMVNGILGCDFLYGNDIIIDFKNKTVSNK